ILVTRRDEHRGRCIDDDLVMADLADEQTAQRQIDVTRLWDFHRTEGRPDELWLDYGYPDGRAAYHALPLVIPLVLRLQGRDARRSQAKPPLRRPSCPYGASVRSPLSSTWTSSDVCSNGSHISRRRRNPSFAMTLRDAWFPG